jgi:uncharacterized protein HemX
LSTTASSLRDTHAKHPAGDHAVREAAAESTRPVPDDAAATEAAAVALAAAAGLAAAGVARRLRFQGRDARACHRASGEREPSHKASTSRRTVLKDSQAKRYTHAKQAKNNRGTKK